MANTIAGTYATLVTLGSAIDNPTTITATGMLNAGVRVSYAGLTLANIGQITSGAGDYGIKFITSGRLTNQSGGTIGGTLYGVQSSNLATVTNSGLIGGTAAAIGVALATGQVTNLSSGTIAASSSGVRIFDGGTVTNAGTIQGGADAVHFYPGATALLLVDPGAVFTGLVDGGNTAGATAVSTLELASGATAGTISGLGSQYINFARVAVDATAQWAFGPADTVGAGGTLSNAGTIDGPVTLATGATLYNGSAATITAYGGTAVYGLAGAGPGATIVNHGIVSNYALTLSYGISLAGGGSITNDSGGTISGYAGIGAGYALTVVNAGVITGYSTLGVALTAGGTVTNDSGGTISGLFGVSGGTAAVNVLNAGQIYGLIAVELTSGGSVTNQIGGTISGIEAIFSGGSLTVVNGGSIDATGQGAAIEFEAGGYVTNHSGGSIIGYHAIDSIFDAITVVNAGSIATAAAGSYAAGIYLTAGGGITNQSGGSITGYQAIYSVDQAVSVVNAGVIAGTMTGPRAAGVLLYAGGSVTNQTGGTIGGSAAIAAFGPLTVVNTGTVSGYYYGVGLFGGGSVTNQAGGTISANVAVYGSAAAAVAVVNAGNIAGGMTNASYAGVRLSGGGSVTNDSSGTIAGTYGIDGGSYGALNVINAGTIIGSTYAVKLTAGYAGRVVVDPGAVFTGAVDGGNTAGATAVSTLEFAAGASGGAASMIGTRYFDFGQITIDAGAAWTFSGAGTIGAGTTLTNSGTLTVLDTTLDDSGTVVNDGVIEIDPSSVTIAALTGIGTNGISGGSTLDILGTVTAGETIAFGTGNNLLAIGPAGFAGQIDGFVIGDTIELNGVTDGTRAAIVNANTLEVQRSSNPPVDLMLDPSVSYAGLTYSVTPSGLVTEIPCFLSGTRIRTPCGEVPVQLLAVGDYILTLSGRTLPICWIGSGRVIVSPANRCAATPIIVRKSALADNVPYDDLRITKGHALFLDGVLIPAEFLVNHLSIHWDDHRREVEFHHIELETHDVLIANGAAAESYRDDGNRWLFRNANTGWAQPEKPPCAPVLTGGPFVDAVWRRLLDRVPSRPEVVLTDDADVHLMVDGVRVDPDPPADGAALLFRLPRSPREVRIASRAAAPAELGLARDPRRLGVAVSRIMVCKGVRLRLMEADDPALSDGFHGFEPALGLRWTQGDAVLPPALFDGFEGAIEVVLRLAGAARYRALAGAGARFAA